MRIPPNLICTHARGVLSARGWAPGVYLVRAEVTAEGGAVQTHVRRFTLARR